MSARDLQLRRVGAQYLIEDSAVGGGFQLRDARQLGQRPLLDASVLVVSPLWGTFQVYVTIIYWLDIVWLVPYVIVNYRVIQKDRVALAEILSVRRFIAGVVAALLRAPERVVEDLSVLLLRRLAAYARPNDGQMTVHVILLRRELRRALQTLSSEAQFAALHHHDAEVVQALDVRRIQLKDSTVALRKKIRG